MDSHDINTPEEMTNTIAHTDQAREAHRVLGLCLSVHGRASLAGVHLGETPPNGTVYDIEMADHLPAETIAAIGIKAAHAHDGALTPDEEVAFLQFREYWILLKKAADDSQIKDEINTRFIFGSGSRTVRLITSHGQAQRAIGEENALE
jgi:hypothetical protein